MGTQARPAEAQQEVQGPHESTKSLLISKTWFKYWNETLCSSDAGEGDLLSKVNWDKTITALSKKSPASGSVAAQVLEYLESNANRFIANERSKDAKGFKAFLHRARWRWGSDVLDQRKSKAYAAMAKLVAKEILEQGSTVTDEELRTWIVHTSNFIRSEPCFLRVRSSGQGFAGKLIGSTSKLETLTVNDDSRLYKSFGCWEERASLRAVLFRNHDKNNPYHNLRQQSLAVKAKKLSASSTRSVTSQLTEAADFSAAPEQTAGMAEKVVQQGAPLASSNASSCFTWLSSARVSATTAWDKLCSTVRSMQPGRGMV